MSDTQAPAPAPSAPFESDGYTIQSNTKTADEIRETFPEEKPKNGDAEPEPKEAKVDISKAASELGKKGGAAAAKARKADQKAEGADGDASVAGAAVGEGVSEPSEDEVESAPERPLGKPRDDPKARMLQATRQAAEAKRLLQQREAELQQRDAYIAQLRAEYEQQRPRPEQAPPQREAPGAEQPPKEEDFENYNDFIRAAARFEAREAYRQEQQEMRAQAEVDAYAYQIDTTLRGFNGRIQEAFGAEFETRVSEEIRELLPSVMLPENAPVGPLNVVADEIISSDVAPQLMVYLSEHPDDFQRLATLPSPQAIAREMAKLEAKIEVATAGNPTPIRAVSKAKPPVRPVTGSPHTADELSPDLSYDEHVRVMNARERRR